jgi:hypothetical protein
MGRGNSRGRYSRFMGRGNSRGRGEAAYSRDMGRGNSRGRGKLHQHQLFQRRQRPSRLPPRPGRRPRARPRAAFPRLVLPCASLCPARAWS